MSVLTYKQINNYASSVSFKEAEALVKSASVKNSLQQDLFLSHSSLDNALLPGVIKFFKNFSSFVYIDAGDEKLPSVPSPTTAQILKRKIKSLSRFVILLSPDSYRSNWIPWELGLADGFKGQAKIALLPTSPNPDGARWINREYLGLYPRIIKGKLHGYTNEVWKVYDPRDKTSWSLEYWLHEDVE